MEKNDSELMSDVRAGHTGRLATLFERHHARVYRFALRMTGNRQAAEDVVQDVFMRMLKYRKSFREGMAFTPWMFRIARNSCAEYLHRTARDPLFRDAPDGADQTPAQTDDVEQDRAALVRKALLALPIDAREVLVLSRYEFKSYDEIAHTVGCSVGAVKVRAHRALKRLREIYLQLEQEALQ